MGPGLEPGAFDDRLFAADRRANQVGLPGAGFLSWGLYELLTLKLRRRREILFDGDSAESPAEFFATAVELFFEYPRDLQREFPAVHSLLAEYLEIDPGAWPTR